MSRRRARHTAFIAAFVSATIFSTLLDDSASPVSRSNQAAVPVVHRQHRAPQAPRRLLLSAAGASLLGASPGLLQPQPASASSLATPFGGIDLSFLDPPAPPDFAKPPADAEVLPSGLASKILLRPTCALSKYAPPEVLAKCKRARPYDKVVIDYTGWQVSNAKMFDSSRLEKRSIRVSSVMPGWTEGLQLMSPGETRRFWIPASLAYGDNPGDSRPAGDLVFDIVMYAVDPQPKPPDDLARPPSNAAVTSSGLAYKQLKAGSGSRKPSPDSTVTVTYSGWQPSGELFMSSSLGAPKTFKVKEIPIKGLTEGVQMMVEGEEQRFWIPAELAFGEKPANGLPGGMLVFEVQLSGIE